MCVLLHTPSEEMYEKCIRPMSDETLVARVLLRNQCCAAKVARLSWKDASGSTCCAAKFKVAHCSNRLQLAARILDADWTTQCLHSTSVYTTTHFSAAL